MNDLVGCSLIPNCPEFSPIRATRVCQPPFFGPAPFAGVLLSLFSLSPSAGEPASCPIGLLVPADASEASSLIQGATLGVKHSNLKSGTRVRLVVRGRPGQWGTEGDEAAILALDDEVAGMITPPGGTAAHQVLQIAGRTRIPVVSLCPDSSVTGAGVPWACRIVPSLREEGRAIFAGLTNFAGTKAPRRWVALVPPERAGREAARDLADAAVDLGLEPPKPISIPASTQERKPLADQVLAHQSDGVFLRTTPEEAGELARLLRKAGFKGWLAGPGHLRSASFLRVAGDAAEGVVIATLAETPDVTGNRQRFHEEYRATFSGEPDLMAMMAHDAVVLLAERIRAPDQQAALRGFAGQAKVGGVTGPLQFDASGNRVVSLVAQICQGSEFRDLWRNSPSHREHGLW